MKWLDDLRKRFKEPTTVPPWMGIVGTITTIIGFFFILLGFFSLSGSYVPINQSIVIIFEGAMIFSAGSYSWGLSDGWNRALKAMP